MLGKKEPSMLIVGCDFHPSWQQIAVFDEETGEVNEYKLSNGDGAAEQFYRKLPAPARIGLEACGNSQGFVNLLQELGHEVWIGDAAQIRASYVRKQKTDQRDALHILKLLLENRFPRLWTPTAEIRGCPRSRAFRDLGGYDVKRTIPRVSQSRDPGHPTKRRTRKWVWYIRADNRAHRKGTHLCNIMTLGL